MKRFALAMVAIAACGDSTPPPIDVGVDAPDRCARTRDRYQECRVCIEAHATLLGTTSPDARLYAVDGGVLFAFQTELTVVYVSDVGSIVGNLSVHDAELGSDWSWLEPVPGSQTVWGILNLNSPTPTEEASVLVLFEMSDIGLTELASTRLPVRVGPTSALSTGELLFGAHNSLDGDSLYACRTSDGAIRCRTVDSPIGIPVRIWSTSSDAAVVASSESRNGTGATWLQTVDITTGTLSEAEQVGANPSAEFTEDGVPRVATLPSSAYAIHRDHTATVLLRGTFAGMDASPLGHYFIRRISAEGEFLDSPPGTWINPDSFALSWNEPDTLVTGGIRAAAENATYVSWPTESSANFRLAQLLDADGTTRFPTAVTISNNQSERERAPSGWVDGAERTYTGNATLTEANPERPFEAEFSVDLLTDDLEYLWDEPVFYQSCERLDERLVAGVGAFDEGVWVVWVDVVRGGVDGLPYTQLKIARIMPDGDYGWRFDE